MHVTHSVIDVWFRLYDNVQNELTNKLYWELPILRLFGPVEVVAWPSECHGFHQSVERI